MKLGDVLLARQFARGPAGQRLSRWAESQLLKEIGHAPPSLERSLGRIARFSQHAGKLFVSNAQELAQVLKLMCPSGFKQGLERLTEKDWLEILLKAPMVGKGQFRSVKGFIRELQVPHMDQFQPFIAELEEAAGLHGGRWSAKVRVARSVTDLDGRELGDYLMIVESTARTNGEPDELWIMAIIESKSLSNSDDLVGHGEARLIGQHQWDLVRIRRSGGIRVDGHEIPQRRLRYGTPWSERTPPAGELQTRFLGVIPRALTRGESNRLSFAGIAIEVWEHVVDDEVLDSVSKIVMKVTSSM